MPSKRGTRLLAAAGWFGWLAIALIIRHRVSPKLGHVGGSTSDEAIPQLMANAAQTIPYDIYYWGQDRLGAWPFLLARGIRYLTGFGWTTDSLHWLLAAFLLSAIFPLTRLAGRWGNTLAAAFLLALVFDRRGEPASAIAAVIDLAPHPWHPAIFHSDQPYGWMLAPLLWGWWALRGSFEADGRRDVVRTAGYAALAALCAFLATWLTQLGLVFTLLIGLVEACRLGPLTAWALGRRLLILTVVLSFAWRGELGLHDWYASDSAARNLWFQPFGGAEVDVGHLREDLVACWDTFRRYSAWVASPLAVVLAIGLLVQALRGRTAEARDLVVFCVALTSAAMTNAAAVTVVRWTRLNHHSPRYFALTDLFAILAACVGILALLPARLREHPRTPAVAAVILCVAALVALPSNPVSATAPAFRQACAELPARAPGAVLLGSYWGTYSFVDGSAVDPVIPVVEEMEFVRNPWTVDLLATANPVIVSHAYDNRYGPKQDPVPFIQEYGSLLELSQPRWVVGGDSFFSLYRNRTADLIGGVRATSAGHSIAAPCRTQPCLPLPPREAGVEALRIDWPPRASGTVALFFGATNDIVRSLPAFRVDAGAGTETAAGTTAAPAVSTTVHPPVMVVRFSGPSVSGVRLTYEATSGEAPPSLRAAVVLPAANDR